MTVPSVPAAGQAAPAMQSPVVQQAAGTNGASPAQAAPIVPQDHVLTLVAGCVVNQRAFANTCGVPLGAHMDFLPSGPLRLPRVGRAPVRCSGCSGFMNVYCKTNLLKWVWKCNMCGTVNINKEQLGHSADTASYAELSAEAVEYVVAPPEPSAPQQQQQQQPPAHLVFAVDTTMEPADLQAAKAAIQAALAPLPPATLVSLVTFDGCVALHNLSDHRCAHVLPSAFAAAAPSGGGGGGAEGAGPGAGAAARHSHSAAQQAAIQQLLDKYCAATAARSAAAAAAAGGDVAPSGSSGSGGGGEGGGGALVSPVGSCASVLPRVLASLRTVQADVPVRHRARSLCAAVEASLRLIAAAAGLDLSRHHSLHASRVVVLAGGPATRGPGAVSLELLDQAVTEKGRAPENRAVAAALDLGAALGAMGAKIGVAVDIFTSTATGINAPLLTAIAHGSGGELMPQLTASAHHHHFHHHHHDNISSSSQPPQQRSVNGSSGSGSTGGFVPGLLSRQLAAALGRRFGVAGRLDCFVSEGLRLTQWMGPLDALRADLEDLPPAAAAASTSASASSGDAPHGAAAAPGTGSAWRLSAAACGVAALEVGRGASLRLEVTRDLEVPSLVLQVALHFTDVATRTRVVRVVTRKMQVVDNRSEFLRTVNPAAAAALLGKRAVLDAKKAGAFRDGRKAEEARYAVGAQLGLVAARCGKEVQASRGVLGFGGRKLRQWPPELMPLAYALYHFTRGPILGPPAPPPPGTHPAAAHSHLHSLWDTDVRLVGINSLLWSAWGDAYRAMAPKLYAVLPAQVPVQLPASPFTDGATAAAAAAMAPPPPQLAALPCVSLAAVMARTVPLLLDAGTAVLVSPTEEPAAGGGGGGGFSCVGLTAELVEAALAAVGPAGVELASGGGGGVRAVAGRFPVPSMVLASGAQAGGGGLAARLIPVHRDGYEEQALQQPQLQQLGQAVAAQLSKQLMEGSKEAAASAAAAAAAAGVPPVQAKAAAAAAASFVEWCRGVNVQPLPTR